MSKQKNTRKKIPANTTGSKNHKFRNWQKVLLGVTALALAGGLFWCELKLDSSGDFL